MRDRVPHPYKPQKNVAVYSKLYVFILHSFIVMCKMRRFLAVLRSFFQSSLLCTLSLHTVLPTDLPSFLTSSCHLFLCLPLRLVVSKFILIFWGGILFSSILCTCPNQCNLFSVTVSAIENCLTIV